MKTSILLLLLTTSGCSYAAMTPPPRYASQDNNEDIQCTDDNAAPLADVFFFAAAAAGSVGLWSLAIDTSTKTVGPEVSGAEYATYTAAIGTTALSAIFAGSAVHGFRVAENCEELKRKQKDYRENVARWKAEHQEQEQERARKQKIIDEERRAQELLNEKLREEQEFQAYVERQQREQRERQEAQERRDEAARQKHLCEQYIKNNCYREAKEICHPINVCQTFSGKLTCWEKQSCQTTSKVICSGTAPNGCNRGVSP